MLSFSPGCTLHAPHRVLLPAPLLFPLPASYLVPNLRNALPLSLGCSLWLLSVHFAIFLCHFRHCYTITASGTSSMPTLTAVLPQPAFPRLASEPMGEERCLQWDSFISTAGDHLTDDCYVPYVEMVRQLERVRDRWAGVHKSEPVYVDQQAQIIDTRETKTWGGAAKKMGRESPGWNE